MNYTINSAEVAGDGNTLTVNATMTFDSGEVREVTVSCFRPDDAAAVIQSVENEWTTINDAIRFADRNRRIAAELAAIIQPRG